jgi:hypothetical protein
MLAKICGDFDGHFKNQVIQNKAVNGMRNEKKDAYAKMKGLPDIFMKKHEIQNWLDPNSPLTRDG